MDPREIAYRYLAVESEDLLSEGIWMFEGWLREGDYLLEKALIDASKAGYFLHASDLGDGRYRLVFIPRRRTKSNIWVNVFLFILTLISTLLVGALYEGVDLIAQPWLIWKGLPFSAAIIGILLIHEMGHFIASKFHDVDATLPYFIPFPTIIGTMGALIRIKSPIPTRKALMDIGAAGPIAGFLAAIPITALGLKLSKFMKFAPGQGTLVLGDNLIFKIMTKIFLGQAPPGYDVALHPVAFAGWIGFFITALNLFPMGQLDGGHIAYAMFGRRHIWVAWASFVVLVALGTFWQGWWFWALLVLILGIKHPPPLVDQIPLDGKRWAIGVATAIIFILTFTPVPFAVK